MQIIKFRYIVIYLVLLFGLTLFLPSCANTTAPPSGGVKDTLAPVLLKVEPDSNKINFPLRGQKI